MKVMAFKNWCSIVGETKSPSPSSLPVHTVDTDTSIRAQRLNKVSIILFKPVKSFLSLFLSFSYLAEDRNWIDSKISSLNETKELRSRGAGYLWLRNPWRKSTDTLDVGQ